MCSDHTVVRCFSQSFIPSVMPILIIHRNMMAALCNKLITRYYKIILQYNTEDKIVLLTQQWYSPMPPYYSTGPLLLNSVGREIQKI